MRLRGRESRRSFRIRDGPTTCEEPRVDETLCDGLWIVSVEVRAVGALGMELTGRAADVTAIVLVASTILAI